MRTVDQVLETLDNKLDEVDELLNALPLKAERKKQLTSMVYNLWMEVEDDMATLPADFG